MDSPRFTRKPRMFVSARVARQRRFGFAFLLLALAARAGAQETDPEGLQFAAVDGSWTTAAGFSTQPGTRDTLRENKRSNSCLHPIVRPWLGALSGGRR